MILGVTEAEQKIITNILEKYYDKYSFYYFGYCINGNYSAVLDLDILIKGKIYKNLWKAKLLPAFI